MSIHATPPTRGRLLAVLPVLTCPDKISEGNSCSRLKQALVKPQILLLFTALACATGSAGVPKGSRHNLLTNGGFEDSGKRQNGVAAGWETLCGGPHPEIYALDTVVRHSGRQSQRMGSVGYNYRWVESGGYCFDKADGREHKHPVPLEIGNQALAQTTKPGAIKPGHTYKARVWVKIQGLTEKWEWFRLGIYWLDGNGQFISEVREPDADKPNVGSHDWKAVEAVGKAPERAAAAKVYLHHHFTHGTVWYDDVSLTDVTGEQQATSYGP